MFNFNLINVCWMSSCKAAPVIDSCIMYSIILSNGFPFLTYLRGNANYSLFSVTSSDWMLNLAPIASDLNLSIICSCILYSQKTHFELFLKNMKHFDHILLGTTEDLYHQHLFKNIAHFWNVLDVFGWVWSCHPYVPSVPCPVYHKSQHIWWLK